MPTKKAKPAATFPAYKDVKYVVALTLKKPYVSVDPETDAVTTEIVMVGENGRAQILPCTQAAFKRVNGKRFKTKGHSGLWRKTHTTFLVAIEKSGEKRVVGVDTFPAQLYGNSSSDAPTFRKNQQGIKLSIDQKNGDITVEELQPKTVPNRAAMTNLLRAVHGAPNIVAGDTISGYEVLSRDGAKLTLEPVSDPDEGEE